MGLVIYPNFPCDIPEPLQKVLEESGRANRLLEYAVTEYQDKKMGGGKHFVVHRVVGTTVEKPLSFWIKKLFWREETVVLVESDLGQEEQIEDAYIAKDLQFFLRGRVIKYKDTGGIQSVQLSHIEPMFKSKPVEAQKDLRETLADKLIKNWATVNKSSSYLDITPINPVKSASYANISLTGSYLPSSKISVDVGTVSNSNISSYQPMKISLEQIEKNEELIKKVDLEALYTIFQDMIDNRHKKSDEDTVENPISRYFKTKKP